MIEGIDRRRICPLFLVAVGWVVELAGVGQGAFAQPASSVQLPTFSYFGVGTSVLVPDRGGAVLGGVSRSASQIRQFRVPGPMGGALGIASPGPGGWPHAGWGQRSSGTTSSAQIAGVSVWIHDFEAMEAQLLGQRQPAVGTVLSALPGLATENSQPGQQQPVLTPRPSGSDLPLSPGGSPMSLQDGSTAAQPVLSVAELRRLREAEREAQNQEASEWVQRAENAQQEAKLGLARIYYQMALGRASGPLKAEIERRLERLRPSAQSRVSPSNGK